MRVVELFEEEHISNVMKALHQEFRDLAKKYQLTLAGGMGWPAITKDGAWMGGGMLPYRGISDEDAVLNIEKRRRAFLRAVAGRLEELLKSGRVVKIARGGLVSGHQEDARPGEIEKQLNDNMVIDKPPRSRDGKVQTVIWFVSAPAGINATNFVNIQASFFMPPGPFGYQGYGSYNTFIMPNDAQLEKAITRMMGKVKKGFKPGTSQNGWVETFTPEYRNLTHDLLKHMMDIGLPVRPPSDKRLTFEMAVSEGHPRLAFTKTRVKGRGTEAFPIDTILPVLEKHGLQR